MIKKEGVKKSCLRPMPRVIVSVTDKSGRDNALVVGYCGNCSYAPPMVMIGIVPSRYSYNMIKESGTFVVNLAVKENKQFYDYLGKISGRDEDKFKKLSLNTERAKMIDAPILSDCPVNIECSVVDSIMTGSHEMFIGKVLYVHADETLIDEKGNIDYNKLDLI